LILALALDNNKSKLQLGFQNLIKSKRTENRYSRHCNEKDFCPLSALLMLNRQQCFILHEPLTKTNVHEWVVKNTSK